MVKRDSSFLLKLLDGLIFLVTLLCGSALLLAYIAPHVDPNDHLWFAFLGLVAPFLYLANLLLMLYWAVRWRWVVFLPMALLLLGAGHVGKYFRPQIKHVYRSEDPQQKPEGSVRVLSYNVGGFWGKTDGKYVSRMTETARYIAGEKPDIICFQEYEVNHVHTEESLDQILEPLRYKAVAYVFPNWGLAIYSRYRILAKGSLTFPESTNSAMWADLLVGRDTVRVFNCHLQTTQVNEEDRDFLRSEPMQDSLREDKALGIARKLGRNFQKRALQADSLAGLIHDGRPRVIVCGDFNDTPMSYTYRRMRGPLQDAFQNKGRGMVNTYRELRGLLRIDYLFHSKDFETLDYQSEQPGWSDHNPVIVDIKLTPKK